MRIRIVSDGTPFGTRLYDIGTGGELTETFPVVQVDWHLDMGGPAVAELKALLVNMDVVAEVKRIQLVNPGILDLGELCDLCEGED